MKDYERKDIEDCPPPIGDVSVMLAASLHALYSDANHSSEDCVAGDMRYRQLIGILRAAKEEIELSRKKIADYRQQFGEL
jgi:hypothetical protein